jgi:hypothetical protein
MNGKFASGIEAGNNQETPAGSPLSHKLQGFDRPRNLPGDTSRRSQQEQRMPDGKEPSPQSLDQAAKLRLSGLNGLKLRN